MKIAIYQIAMERDENRLAFQSLNHIISVSNGRVPAELYDCVFAGEVSAQTLEDIFYVFNMEHPSGYKGRSLSVSDVVEIFLASRGSEFYAKETDPNAIERARIQYIINPIECGDRSEEHTVREWVESFGIPIHDNDFIAWQKALFSVRQQIVELEKMLPDKSMERVWSITYQALYLNYDIQEDFREQFQKNSDRLIDALEHLPALWKELSHE